MRLTFTTAGESHGKGLVAIVEGLPAGLPVSAGAVNRDLARRMRQFANDLCVPRGIHIGFTASEADDVRLGDELRRHVYLVFKEAINNAVRHSDCSRSRRKRRNLCIGGGEVSCGPTRGSRSRAAPTQRPSGFSSGYLCQS